MREGKRRRGLTERLGMALALPLDVVAGLPLVELQGDSQLRVENHRGILAYAPEEIHINGGKISLRVVGEGLELKTMQRGELLITGRVRAVEVE